MKNLVDKIREYNVLMGKYEKNFLWRKKNLQASRRSIYAKKVILKNKYLLESDISIIRPGRI